MPARFTLIFSPSFRRDLERLPRRVHDEVLEAIGQLELTPKGPSPKIKKLKGKGIGQWRLEVWPYRLRYEVIGREVHLYRVRHRKDIYGD
ncbi:MAG: type II toxin-antitoxin system mRNA interferase toxin, RelE/StbE family [Acidobacteria bacterium]|nr:type II toxin-antitoxin system mRNA interferase toxin, RelE/StbE family [Acidobacteriota bacterium]